MYSLCIQFKREYGISNQLLIPYSKPIKQKDLYYPLFDQVCVLLTYLIKLQVYERLLSSSGLVLIFVRSGWCFIHLSPQIIIII